MQSIRMECHNDAKNQHKYWEVSYEAGQPNVLTAWGRLPGYGRSASRTQKWKAMPAGSVLRFVERKLVEKYNKGYNRIGQESVQEESDTKLESEEMTEQEIIGIARRISAL